MKHRTPRPDRDPGEPLLPPTPLREANPTKSPARPWTGAATTSCRPARERYGMGVPVRSPLGQGLLIGPLDVAHAPPALRHPTLRRRPADERSAA
jgi:hypothetical protein